MDISDNESDNDSVTGKNNLYQSLDVLPTVKRRIQLAAPHHLSGSISSFQSHFQGVVEENHMSTDVADATFPSAAWPSRIPVEIFKMFAKRLSPRDVRSMRLVCKDFEERISPILFEEVVVPFTSELYDMVEDDVSVPRTRQQTSWSIFTGKGKGKAMEVSSPPSVSQQPHEDGTYYQASRKDAPKHGRRIFQGFGPHMKKFGIRFDLTEAEMSLPPPKKSTCRQVEAYHGDYAWPPPGYSRFGRLEKLEQMADETPRMTAALATLTHVREIGLSIDSGLGYLSGPDRSGFGAAVSGNPAPLFEEDATSVFSSTKEAEDFWACVEASHGNFIDPSPSTPITQERLVSCSLPTDSQGFSALCPAGYGDTSKWPTTRTNYLPGARVALPSMGNIYTQPEIQKKGIACPPLSPSALTSDQKQWLLETGWAQNAFLDSYILAVFHNSQIFRGVKKVTISKISSGLLIKLDSNTFWDALPNMEELKLLVSPDWRSIGKDEAGWAETVDHDPSNAVSIYHDVLSRLMDMKQIKKLVIGYASGGENIQGMFGRNANLMPAPLTIRDLIFDPQPTPISFPQIAHLELRNCWLTPCMLLRLAKSRQTAPKLLSRTLTLDSVSLTVNPKGVSGDDFYRLSDIDQTHLQGYRHGSWPDMISRFKSHFNIQSPNEALPSPFLTNFSPQHLTLPQPPRQTLTFSSCGYAAFPTTWPSLEEQNSTGLYLLQPRTADPHTYIETDWHRNRANQILSHMMLSSDGYLARVTAHIEANEKAALEASGMLFGWPATRAKETKFDGAPLGGTGRFTGVLR